MNRFAPSSHIDQTTRTIASHANATPPVKPEALPVQFEHIPADLKAEARWCVWDYVLSEQRSKWVKTPINAATLFNAKSNDPATWVDYDTAFNTLRQNPSLAGLGFFLGDGWTGIDIDDCHDFLDGFNAIAADILKHAPGYAEISPSLTGVKIILRAPIPRSKQVKHGGTGLEIYDHSRFFTVTGHAVSGRDNTIPLASNINELYARYFDATGTITSGHSVAQGDMLVGAVPRVKDITIERLRDDLRWLDPEMLEPDWFKIICAINHQFCDTHLEDDAKEVALQWTDQGSKADPDGFEDRWERARQNPGVAPVTYATIIKMVNDTKANESLDAAVARLAELPTLEFDRVAKGEAKRLGVKVSNLEKEVKQVRAEANDLDGGPFEPVEAWHESVNGGVLLDELFATVRRFIVCEPETAQAVALWITMSWLMHVVNIAPLAVITAPEKRCGKSQLLFLMTRLVCRPLASSNISPAALFRAIEAWKPTLLLDETDAALKGNEDLRGLLNSGHTRPGAYVLRTVGEEHEPKQFSTWGAKALAGIGHLSPTLMDRAIALELRRKLPHERVDKLRHNEEEPFKRLRSWLARWAADNAEAVRISRPEIPEALHDRAADNWEPLMQIAAVAGCEWPTMARNAALALSRGSDATSSVGVELLADIRAVFEQKRVSSISLADLLSELLADDEAPWRTWNRGREMNARQLGKRLREFAIPSRPVRFGNRVAKGFSVDQFTDAFARYLVDVSPDSKQDVTESLAAAPAFLD